MRRPLLALSMLAGCNQIYGLDATRTVDASDVAGDDDGDGVLDAQDNCRAVANAGQQNVDGDELGDACDPCSYVFGATLDRDGDGIAAASDNCPAAANAAQTDTDGDGIGDPCDPRPGTADTRRCFDDFSTDVPALWPLASPWSWLGTPESAMIFHTPAATPPFSLAARTSGLPPTRGAVQIELQTPGTMLGAETGIGIGATRCELVGTGTGVRLRLSEASGMLAEQPLAFSAQRMMVTLGYDASQLACTAHQADGARLAITASTAAPPAGEITLHATNASGLYRALVVYE